MKRSTLKRRERSRTLSSLLHTYEKRQGSPEMASKRQKKSSPKAKRLRFWRLASRSKSPVGEQVSAWEVMKARKKFFWQKKLRCFSETSTETSPCWDLCKLTSKQRYWTLHMWNSQNESKSPMLVTFRQQDSAFGWHSIVADIYFLENVVVPQCFAQRFRTFQRKSVPRNIDRFQKDVRLRRVLVRRSSKIKK